LYETRTGSLIHLLSGRKFSQILSWIIIEFIL
jgi:hypothetical protein